MEVKRKRLGTVLVTGANGCVGRALVRRLCETDADVLALDLDWSETGGIERNQKIETIIGDISDSARMERIIRSRRIDIIVHLAAVVHDAKASEVLYDRINVRATADLFDLACRNHVRQFIFLSTVAVYGKECPVPVTEDDPPSPGTVYSRSKAEAEESVLNLSPGGTASTVIRSATVYGKCDRGNVGKLAALIRKGVVPVIGDGKKLKSLIYVENLAEGILQTMDHPPAFNQVFILTDQPPLSLNQIIESMGKAMGRKAKVIHLPPKPAIFFSEGP